MLQRPGRHQPLATWRRARAPRRQRASASLVGLLAGLVIGCSPTPPTASPGVTEGPTATSVATLTPMPELTPAPPTPSAVPPTAAPTAATAACTPDAMKVSHDLVEGTAGSRFTTAVLTTNAACSVDAFPALGLRDASGNALVSAAPAQPGFVDLQAGVAYESQISFSNWCADEPPFPLTLSLLVAGAEVPITGDTFPDEGAMPPCLAGGGPQLAGTAWVPAS